MVWRKGSCKIRRLPHGRANSAFTPYTLLDPRPSPNRSWSRATFRSGTILGSGAEAGLHTASGWARHSRFSVFGMRWASVWTPHSIRTRDTIPPAKAEFGPAPGTLLSGLERIRVARRLPRGLFVEPASGYPDKATLILGDNRRVD